MSTIKKKRKPTTKVKYNKLACEDCGSTEFQFFSGEDGSRFIKCDTKKCKRIYVLGTQQTVVLIPEKVRD